MFKKSATQASKQVNVYAQPRRTNYDQEEKAWIFTQGGCCLLAEWSWLGKSLNLSEPQSAHLASGVQREGVPVGGRLIPTHSLVVGVNASTKPQDSFVNAIGIKHYWQYIWSPPIASSTLISENTKFWFIKLYWSKNGWMFAHFFDSWTQPQNSIYIMEVDTTPPRSPGIWKCVKCLFPNVYAIYSNLLWTCVVISKTTGVALSPFSKFWVLSPMPTLTPIHLPFVRSYFCPHSPSVLSLLAPGVSDAGRRQRSPKL